VQPWYRYGHRRLYVNTSDGRRVGWYDLQQGAATIELDEHRSSFDAAVARWIVEHPQPDGPPPALPTRSAPEQTANTEQALAPSAPTLLNNRPGAAARARAQEERDAAPVRTVVARLLRVHTDERAWRVGADGEEKVAAQLTKLGPGWHAIHAVPIGENGADIDHVLIGPAGVFTLNAKHHPGGKMWVAGDTVMVNGHRQPYVRNSRHEASRASRLLTNGCGFQVRATGVIVPVSLDDLTIREEPHDVLVINRRRLVRALSALPQILAPDVVDRVAEVARRQSTWRPSTS
jgi:hypothetical protein